MKYIGADPGLKGAIAMLCTETRYIEFRELPVTEHRDRKELDRRELIRLLWVYRDGVGIIEDLWEFGSAIEEGKTGQGQFPFARDYGALLCAFDAVGIKYIRVAPRTWQSRIHKLPGKQGSIHTAEKLYPAADLTLPGTKRKSDGRADALLLAHYGHITKAGINT